MVVVRALVLLVGLFVVLATVGSALTTVVLPRGVQTRLTRVVFSGVRQVFRLRAGRVPTFERRDAVFSGYAPVSLLATLQTWLAFTYLGFALVLWALYGGGWRRAFATSGSSLLTLGTEVPHSGPVTAACFAEASLGLVLLALLITYLPSLYGSFSRREAQVSKLEVRAGRPPTGVKMLVRAYQLGRVEVLTDVWAVWEDWFVDLEETHTSFPSLVWFRSPQPDHSWVTASGAVLDAAALHVSCADRPRDVEAQLALRAGYLALRRIAAYFRLPFPTDPAPDDPVSVTRGEFDEAYDQLAEAGVALRADRDQCWRDFAGWRVNYDQPLVRLAGLTLAPYAPWSSDRSITDLSSRRERARRVLGRPPGLGAVPGPGTYGPGLGRVGETAQQAGAAQPGPDRPDAVEGPAIADAVSGPGSTDAVSGPGSVDAVSGPGSAAAPEPAPDPSPAS